MPADTVTDGIDESVQDDETASDDGGPVRMRTLATATSSLDPLLDVSSSQDPFNANGQRPYSNGVGTSRRQMVTADGVKVTSVNDKQWKEVIQLCNIECGPNLQQRVENAARGIGAGLSAVCAHQADVVNSECAMERTRHRTAHGHSPMHPLQQRQHRPTHRRTHAESRGNVHRLHTAV